MPKGVKGYIEKKMETKELNISLEGIGYKAKVDEKLLELQLGKSHKIHLRLPTAEAGFTVSVGKETFAKTGTGENQRITLKGTNWSQMMDYAKAIEGLRPPEVYKGKGVIIRTEKNLKKVAAFRKEGKKKNSLVFFILLSFLMAGAA